MQKPSIFRLDLPRKARRRSAIGQYEATLVLIVISLSLVAVVYQGVRREARIEPGPIFIDEETLIGGSPPIELVSVYSSSPTLISSMSLDGASSKDGILAFDGSTYSTLQSLCAGGVTTFFSVLAPKAGTLRVTTDGLVWVAGTLGNVVTVSQGEQEVMILAGTSCSITLPGGQTIPQQWTASSNFVSSIPTQGGLGGTSFAFYVPSGGGPHRLLLTSSGGFDAVAL